MGSKPITQRAGTRYGSALPNQEVTVDPEGTTPARFARMSPLKSDGYRPALVIGAGEATQRTIPGGTKTVTTGGGKGSTDHLEKSTSSFVNPKVPGQTWDEFADADCGSPGKPYGKGMCKDVSPPTTETIQEPDQTIEIKGEDWEGNLEREVMGDVRRSNAARKDRRGLTQFRPQAAKDARKSWKFADDKQRKQLLTDAGLSPDATRRDYIKAKKFEAQEKITKGHQALLDTQLTGAVRGDAPGSKTFKGTENLPFAAQTLADQRAQLRATAEKNARERIANQEGTETFNNSGDQSAIDNAKAQYNSNMQQFYAEAENSFGQPRIFSKSNNSPFQMRGFGSKNKK